MASVSPSGTPWFLPGPRGPCAASHVTFPEPLQSRARSTQEAGPQAALRPAPQLSTLAARDSERPRPRRSRVGPARAKRCMPTEAWGSPVRALGALTRATAAAGLRHLPPGARATGPRADPETEARAAGGACWERGRDSSGGRSFGAGAGPGVGGEQRIGPKKGVGGGERSGGRGLKGPGAGPKAVGVELGWSL